MRGKYERKKKRSNASPDLEQAISTTVDQDVNCKKDRAGKPEQKKEEPVASFVELVKTDARFRTELIALLVGVGVLIIYVCQLRQMIDGNALTRTSLKAEIKVTPDDFSIFPMIDGSQKSVIAWDVMIPMENIGNTRTKDLSYLVSADILTSTYWTGVPDGYSFPQRGQIVHGNISGHAKMSFNPFPVRVENIERVQTGADHVLFHGWARYHDTFVGTPEHLLMFCYELASFAKDARVVGDLTQAPPVLWNACNQHNCADNECKGQKGLPDGFSFKDSP